MQDTEHVKSRVTVLCCGADARLMTPLVGFGAVGGWRHMDGLGRGGRPAGHSGAASRREWVASELVSQPAPCPVQRAEHAERGLEPVGSGQVRQVHGTPPVYPSSRYALTLCTTPCGRLRPRGGPAVRFWQSPTALPGWPHSSLPPPPLPPPAKDVYDPRHRVELPRSASASGIRHLTPAIRVVCMCLSIQYPSTSSPPPLKAAATARPWQSGTGAPSG